jgi:DnaJ domain
MFNPYTTLGLTSSASKDEAKTAFRKLARKHHPDLGGDEEQFKKIKGAWESIDNDWIAESAPTPRQYASQPSSFTQQPSPPQQAWQGTYSDPWSPHYNPPTRSTYRPTPRPYSRTYVPTGPNVVQAYNPTPQARTHMGDFIARVSMAEAFKGFICEVTIAGEKYRVSIPPGIPDGLRFTIPVEDDSKDDVTVITRFTQSAFGFKSINTALREGVIVNCSPGQVYRTKDLTITLPIDARVLKAGGTLKFESFLGEQLELKVPRDHNPRQTLKIEGKGYVDWYTSHSQAGDNRGDILVSLQPTEIPQIDLSGR